MILYKFLLTKSLLSILTSLCMIYSVLYMFSLIELLNEKHNLIDTLFLGIINTTELVTTIPIIIFVGGVIIFGINLKKNNELLILRHYISNKSIILVFSISILFFTAFDVNKVIFKDNISDFKNQYLKKNIGNNIYEKIFFDFKNNNFVITKLSGINLKNKSINEISIYIFKNDNFYESFYSDKNYIHNDEIIMEEIEKINNDSIKKITTKKFIDINSFGEEFYKSNKNSHVFKNISKSKNSLSFLNIFCLGLSLLIYISIFISRRGIQKSSNNIIIILSCFTIFIYNFLTSNLYLEKFNLIFHLFVSLTLLSYLFKNLINE